MSYTFSQFQPIEGKNLRLTALKRSELPHLGEVLVSPTTWFSKTRGMSSVESFVNYFETLMKRQDAGETLSLLVTNKTSGAMLASSTYQYPSPGFRKVEIGFTWIADKWQRSYVNTELKYLMLGYAFDVMKTNRVDFSVHPNNEKSNASMKRLGGGV